MSLSWIHLQIPIGKMVFPFGWSKGTLLEKMVVQKPTYKKMVVGLLGIPHVFFLHHPSGVFVAEEVRQMTTWEAGEPHREPANGQSV